MAEEEEVQIQENAESSRPEFPTGRVKKIMRLDKDVNRVSGEALFLVSRSTELFLHFLAEKSARVAIEKKRKTVTIDHLRVAVKRHQPSSDFLLDSLPLPSQPKNLPPSTAADRRKADKPAPAGTRRIDQFFRKPEVQVAPVADPEAEAPAEADAEAKDAPEADSEAQAAPVEDPEAEPSAEADAEAKTAPEADSEAQATGAEADAGAEVAAEAEAAVHVDEC
ncbi:hypothetical protein HN51_030786 [Arachis hypogaea]|uniref:Transcription factor CBF/NF-Y/archaeal histone domain-containing protein n=3 Tax=Arachis TaxID=3817 RepID=A0A445B9V0_ARAHY|nr:transcription regulator complex subunit bur6 [Arachis duranensis]XP_025622531.1 transcription regulator complex subunit bur6 [Arachis hypogaea]RYR35455.1 hypothetical protein Ahy_A10g050601 isoform A [Arachis hypogaea]